MGFCACCGIELTNETKPSEHDKECIYYDHEDIPTENYKIKLT